MKIEDFRPIRSQDSAPIKFDWLLTQESDWIIWTNQKITLIIFWLVKNGKDWNPAIPLVKRIFLVPDHIWPKTIKGQPALTHVIRNYVLLLVVPPLCLWWVAHIVTKALRLKILPGQQLPLFPNPPTLLTCHLTGKPGEPCRPAPPPAAPSTRDSSTSTSHRGRSDAHKLPTPGRPAGLTRQPNGHSTWWQRHYGRHNDVVFASCVRWAETPAQQHSWHVQQPSTLMTNCRPNEGRTKKYRKKWIFTLCTTAALGVNVRE